MLFQTCDSDHTLFIKKHKEDRNLIVSVYVDDLLYTSNDENLISSFKDSMMHEFEMSDLGKMNYFLGIEIVQRPHGVFICQKRYAEGILSRFGMSKSKAISTPVAPGLKLHSDAEGTLVEENYFKQIVGSLMYLTATRPDLTFATSLISRYMSCPTELHLQAAKRILRYLKGTVDFGIFYTKSAQCGDLKAYTDSDYAGDVEDRKSTSGYVFLMSSGAISWSSKKQPIVTLSTTEAEFVAASVCACQAIWMKRILKELGYAGEDRTDIHCDNSSTIKLSKNPVMHGRSKHIDVRFHFLRNLSVDGVVSLIFCGSADQLADIMTKPLNVEGFRKLRSALGMCSIKDVS